MSALFMSTTKATDQFAQIGANAIANAHRNEKLVSNPPPPAPTQSLSATRHNPAAAFRPLPPTHTVAAFRKNLAALRKSHAPFLKTLAPRPPAALQRDRLALTQWQWRIGTEEDAADFGRVLRGEGDWETVSVPHYGPPTGRYTTYYRTEFQPESRLSAKGAVFLHFCAADYKAHVFLNGNYLGSHEGFFAEFEFDATSALREGKNVLVVRLENDFIHMGNTGGNLTGAPTLNGDKVYAATGLGWDEPGSGWHHCPPGMGLCDRVYLEARPRLHIRDVWVRPLADLKSAEAWIEVWNCDVLPKTIEFQLDLHGLNFRASVFQDKTFTPPSHQTAGGGVTYYRIPLAIASARIWDLATPWLYQLTVRLNEVGAKPHDALTRSFGMRTFTQDTVSTPKGRFFLNGKEIRLRGANTMGHEQQCVLKGDMAQLRDDLLIAKLGNLNFLRLTQRPVQQEVYDMADRLGLLLQSDLPLFSYVRRNQWCEVVRQAEEMERHIRAHPSSFLVSYINEPFPESWGDKKHRYLSRAELESLFRACNEAVRLSNPDRVSKAVDGDYDPPGPDYPDNHMYCGWYGNHGMPIGKLNRGFWIDSKPGWLGGCGEFGAEGLEREEVMRQHYPKAWLPQPGDDEAAWSPSQICKAQTGNIHALWFDTQTRLGDWISVSQAWQAWATRMVTEALRRENRVNSFAIHLLIDAFPAGWMKTILDFTRTPKPAFFEYAQALAPVAVSLRTDRFMFWEGEALPLELWVANDSGAPLKEVQVRYQLEIGGKTVFANTASVQCPHARSVCCGKLPLKVPSVKSRTPFTVRAQLVRGKNQVLHETHWEFTAFPKIALPTMPSVACLGQAKGTAARLLQELGIKSVPLDQARTALVDDVTVLKKQGKTLKRFVTEGGTVILLNPAKGTVVFGDDSITLEGSGGMGDRYFASRKTGHPLVEGFAPRDFFFWHSPAEDRAEPHTHALFAQPSGWIPILTCGLVDWGRELTPAATVAEKAEGNGFWRICSIDLAGRTTTNPTAKLFALRLLGGHLPKL
jgi:hypothetical protein